MDQYVAVRCPGCNRLACRAAAGSRIEAKCVRCGVLFERSIPLQI